MTQIDSMLFLALLLAFAMSVSSSGPVPHGLRSGDEAHLDDAPWWQLAPPRVLHVAPIMKYTGSTPPSIDGHPSLILPPCSGGNTDSCRLRSLQLVALTSAAGVLLRRGHSHNVYTIETSDQLEWLRRVHKQRPGLTIKWIDSNVTVWQLIANITMGSMTYVKFDLMKQPQSLAAARMASSRLNATMIDSSLVAEAERNGFVIAAPVTVDGVTWPTDVSGYTDARVLQEWLPKLSPGRMGLEQFINGGNFAYQSDIASAWPLTAWSPESRVTLGNTFLDSLVNDSLVFGLCHSDSLGLRESTMVRNTSVASKILTVSEGLFNIPLLSSFRTTNTSTMRQRTQQRELPKNKHYVSFQMTDGDALDFTLAGARPGLLEGFWNDPKRGQFPVSWGAAGHMRDLIQPIVESLYSDSTVNDSHFLQDGYGYGAPSLFSAPTRQVDARNLAKVARDMDISMAAMFSISANAWDTVTTDWAPYAESKDIQLLEFWRQDAAGSECYVANEVSQRGAIKWIGDTPVVQPRAALWSGPKLVAESDSQCLGLNRTRPAPPCPMFWLELSKGACVQGCPDEAQKRDNVTQRCFCDESVPNYECLAGLQCLAITGSSRKQCVNCQPLEDPQCFDQKGLATFLNKQVIDPASQSGYSVVPVHVWAYNISQLAAVVEQLDMSRVEVVSPQELGRLIRQNVQRPSLFI